MITMDNRGAGESTSPFERRLSVRDLCADAIFVLEHLQLGDRKVHVWGASMGGFTALGVADILVKRNRLKSLYLQVTAAHMLPFALNFEPATWKAMLGMAGVVKKTQLETVELLLTSSFSKEFLASPESARVRKHWQENFEKLFSWNLDTFAQQTCVNVGFQFSQAQCDALRASGVPIVVHIQDSDEAMKTARQRELATMLRVSAFFVVGPKPEPWCCFAFLCLLSVQLMVF